MVVCLLPFHFDWNVNIGTVGAILISVGAGVRWALSMFWKAHRENQSRLGGIEQRLTELDGRVDPLHAWFTEHVVKNWRG